MSKKAIQHGKSLTLPAEYHNLAEMIQYVANQYPQKGLTFVDASGNEEFLRYPELVKNARQCLSMLYRKGIRPGEVIILEIDQSKDFYCTFWACILGGIVAAPVSQPTSWKPLSAGLLKLTRIWEVLQKPIIIMEEHNRKYYESLQQSSHYEGIHFISTQELETEGDGEPYDAQPDELAFLQFSSGSTGIPKGVKLSSRNILINALAMAERFETKESDTVFTWLPHTHDMGLFVQHITPIVSGSNIVIFSPYTFVRSPYLFLRKMSEHRATWFGSTNFGFDWMVQKIADEKLASLDLSSLRFVLNGAEPISIHVVNSFAKKFEPCGYKPEMMLPAYGMAEATVGVSISRMDEVPKVEYISRSKLIHAQLAVPVQETDERDRLPFVHEGTPLPEISIRIADEHGNTVDEYVVGEIQIQGGSVTSGYYNRDDLTESLFVDGWLHTGDLGFIAEGSLVVSGRMKDIIFIRGQNYFAHDLEEVLYEQAAIPRGNIAFVGLFNGATQQEELLAFVKHKSGVEKLLDLRHQIITHMRESLGIEVTHVIPVRTIPKTTSGKLQRFELRKNYEAGEYDEALQEIHAGLEQRHIQERVIHSPQNELESFLRRSWAEVLGIQETRISTYDSFLALGGSSIQRFQFLDRIEKHFGREIGFELFVICKTIKQMADYLQTMPQAREIPASAWDADNKLDLHNAVAITGIALRVPGASTPQQYWENLCTKKDSIAKVSEKRRQLAGKPEWDDWLGEIANIDYFDNDFFEISDEEAAFMDPQQRLMLEIAYEALEDAGALPGLDEKRNIGVYTGININTYYQLVMNYMDKHGVDRIHPNTMVGNMHNMVSALIAHKLNFTGPALVIDTACSSFLVALHQAVAAIRQNSISGAIVGAANILATPIVHQLSRKAGIVSSTRCTKTFDIEADGSVLGEGVVVVYLEPLTQAVQNNKQIYGIIRGSAVNNDGYSLGIMAPNPGGQYQVLSEAYIDANLSPGEVGYVEAHGSGTRIGDPIEVNALTKLFTEGKRRTDRKIGLGSVKTNIGHLLPAAGGAGLVKVLLSLYHKKLVPSLHMGTRNPALEMEKSPFFIVQDVEEWSVDENNTRKAGISSFGLGGTNVHVVLEEWNGGEALSTASEATKAAVTSKTSETSEASEGSEVTAASAATTRSAVRPRKHLLTLSAKSEQALERVIRQTQELLELDPSININHLCFTRNRYRKHYSYRAACILSNSDSLKAEVEVLQTANRGRFLKNRAAKVALVIGDIASQPLADNLLTRDAAFEQFTIDHLDVLECGASQYGVSEPEMKERVQLSVFFYWYSLVQRILQSGVSITEVRGLGSGQILADLLQERMDIKTALDTFMSESKSIREEGEDKKCSAHEDAGLLQSRADILLGVCMTKEEADKVLSHKQNSKAEHILIESSASDSLEDTVLHTVGQLYVSGADIDWSSLHPDGSGMLVPLPAYPFEQTPHWIQE
ncbi:beta-ketoacyl synthase N-terminal-like domain-containing protein [Paenibacillus alvei]|uniref:beta-ketoacyl synthase N-terminal-like domain-containing protein n=1 Tax=Paenibacillus alvei TaxID=44250 RepID=UPI00227EC7BF|nr:beta-ketoacyl synthase N-terminal-like domain-containing protein [Paenibacillus alvei]